MRLPTNLSPINLVRQRPAGTSWSSAFSVVSVTRAPLLLIWLPDTIVTFHEGQAALKEIETKSDNSDE
jgi:hypothetical protein